MITIKICGKPGEGKTTLALAINQFLIEKNFMNVQINDIDIECGTTYPDRQNKRLEAIRDRHVHIETGYVNQKPISQD